MGQDKLWADLGGRPLLAWSLQAFASAGLIDALVVVVGLGSERRSARLLDEMGINARAVVGGDRRRDSVQAGLAAAPDAEWVVIHDGARPFVTGALIAGVLEAAQETGAAIAAVPVTDTVKMVADGAIVATQDRLGLWAAQTPQVFRRSLLMDAHDRITSDATDDAALVEAIGGTVRVYPGAYGNMKVTFPEDLTLARVLAQSWTPDEDTLGPIPRLFHRLEGGVQRQ